MKKKTTASDKMFQAAKLIRAATAQIRRKNKHDLALPYMEKLHDSAHNQGRLLWASLR